MPRIDDTRPAYLPVEKRKPSGDSAFYKTSAWQKLRKMHLATSPLCEACLSRGLHTDCTKHFAGVVDHIIAISQGGSRTDARNLMTLCKPCHDQKSRLEGNGMRLPTYGEEPHRLPGTGAKETAINEINRYT